MFIRSAERMKHFDQENRDGIVTFRDGLRIVWFECVCGFGGSDIADLVVGRPLAFPCQLAFLPPPSPGAVVDERDALQAALDDAEARHRKPRRRVRSVLS